MVDVNKGAIEAKLGKTYKNQTLRADYDVDYFKIKTGKNVDFKLYMKNYDVRNFKVVLYDNEVTYRLKVSKK